LDETSFYLMSGQGRLLAAAGGALRLVRPEEDGAEASLLRVPRLEGLSGMRAEALLPRGAGGGGLLARAFIVTGGEPGVIGLATDENFLAVSPEGGDLFADRQFGPAAQWRLVPAPAARPETRAKIWIEPLGNVGNRILQYLAAAGIARLAGGAQLGNLQLPECGLANPTPRPPLEGEVHIGTDGFWLDAPGLADCLRRGVMETLVLDGYCFHIDHYPPRDACRALIPVLAGGEAAEGFGPGELVCSIRGDEILTGVHPEYFPLPPGYYARLARLTGLRLVFFGQLGDDAYNETLRAAFPEARFVPGVSAAHDFEVLRRSANIALSISTFAWAAAWLSQARRIYVPVGGIFNPIIQGNQNFLPLEDPAYKFMLLPFTRSVSLHKEPARFFAQQDFIAAHTRQASAPELRALADRALLLRPKLPHVGGFDAAFYARTYEIGGAHPLNHYLHQGAAAGLLPCAFDAEFYLAAYPEAAMAMAEGFYASPVHHYTDVGWRKGYAPTREKRLTAPPGPL
jgi:hypothetical protein